MEIAPPLAENGTREKSVIPAHVGTQSMNDRGKRIAGWSAGLVVLALVATGFVGPLKRFAIVAAIVRQTVDVFQDQAPVPEVG